MHRAGRDTIVALIAAALVVLTGAAFTLSEQAVASVNTQLQTARDTLANCQLLVAGSTGVQQIRARDCVTDQQAIITQLTAPAPTTRPPTATPRPTPTPTPTPRPTTAPSTTPTPRPTTAPPTTSPTTPRPTPRPTTAPSTTSRPTTSAPGPPASAFPARWSVGAPGVGRYRQSDPRLPIPPGYTLVTSNAGPDDSPYSYNIFECGNVVLDHVYIRAFVYLGTECAGRVTITNSIVAPPPGSDQRAILVNSGQTLALSISDTTIRPEPVGKGQTNAALTDHAVNGCERCTINLTRVDVANTGGMCLCGDRLTVDRSWLHDNYIAHLADPSSAHTGGIFTLGGEGPVDIGHTRLEPGTDAYTGAAVANYWMAITAVLFFQDGALSRGFSLHDSFVSMGAYDVALEMGSQLRFTNNVFGPSYWGETTTDGVATFAAWTNNVKGTIDGTPTTAVVPPPWRE